MCDIRMMFGDDRIFTSNEQSEQVDDKIDKSKGLEYSGETFDGMFSALISKPIQM